MNSNARLLTYMFRGKPKGSQRPIGSLPRAGGTARGPLEGLYVSNTAFAAGVISGTGLPIRMLVLLPYQHTDRSCLWYVVGIFLRASASAFRAAGERTP